MLPKSLRDNVDMWVIIYRIFENRIHVRISIILHKSTSSQFAHDEADSPIVSCNL